MTWVEGQNRAFLAVVKIVRCDVVYRTVDFGVPSFFFVDFIVLLLRTNRVPTYQKVRFFSRQNGLSS